MTKKKIAAIAASVVLVGAFVIYTVSALQSFENRIASIELTHSLEEIVGNTMEEAYAECVSGAYDDYSEEWDKSCWRNGDDSDCRLTVIERYSAEYDFHTDVIACIAQYK